MDFDEKCNKTQQTAQWAENAPEFPYSKLQTYFSL